MSEKTNSLPRISEIDKTKADIEYQHIHDDIKHKCIYQIYFYNLSVAMFVSTSILFALYFGYYCVGLLIY